MTFVASKSTNTIPPRAALNPTAALTFHPFPGQDRITSPLVNGYRDVLMNFEIPGTDGLVCELQLHLATIHHKKHEVRHVCGQILSRHCPPQYSRAAHLAGPCGL